MALVRSYSRHPSFITALQITEDNKYVVSGSRDHTIVISRLDNGQLVQVIPIEVDIKAICVTKGNEYVISAGHGPHGDILVSRWEDGQLLRSIQTHEHGCFVSCVCVTSDNKFLLTCGTDDTVQLLRFDTGKLVRILQDNEGYVHSVCLTNDNKYAVSYSDEHVIRMICLHTGQVVHRFPPLDFDFIASNVALNRDNKQLVCGSCSGSITAFRVDNSQLFSLPNVHKRWVRCVAFTPNSKYVVSGSEDKTIKITCLDSGQIIQSIRLRHRVWIVRVSTNGHYIVAVLSNGSVYIYSSPLLLLRRQWAQILLLQRVFPLFHQYPGLLRYLGTKFVLFC